MGWKAESCGIFLFGRAMERISVGAHGEVPVGQGGHPDRLVFGFSIGLSCLNSVCLTGDAMTAFRDDLNGHD
jgi:hypothetical protein